MIVCSRQKRQHIHDPSLKLNLNGQDIAQVDSIDYLGVKLYHNLTFDPHVDCVAAKISISLGALRRVAPFINQDTRPTLFNTIVLPHFDYCSTAWDSCSESQIVKVQRLQNRGMRIIISCKSRTHINDNSEVAKHSSYATYAT